MASYDQYISDVISGEILAGGLIRKACERHLRDLDTGQARGIRFCADTAQRAINFFGFLKHSQGEWAGTVFELQPWQEFIVGSIFGWLCVGSDYRRFGQAYVEVPRKNGKSTLAAGIALYLFCADGEPGAKIYSAATKREQAKIVFDEAVNMVEASPDLKSRIKIYKNNMNIPATKSKFEPLSADAKKMDGLNVHGVIIDELHAHSTRDVFDIVDTATGSRRQALLFSITTAGTDRNSICFEQNEYGRKILDNIIQDDNVFTYIATLDEGDKWDDPAVWAKANPNFGISVKIPDMENKCRKAKEQPANQNSFLRLKLNRWTQQSTRWIDMELWDRQGEMTPVEKLVGRTCYGGLDLATVSDFNALALLFPWDDDPKIIDILMFFWCPEGMLHNRKNRYRDQYQVWKKQGYLMTTPGDAIDYAFICKKTVELAKIYNLVALNIDAKFQGYDLAIKLAEELAGISEVATMGQTYAKFAAPMLEFEARLLNEQLRHGGHPILRFCADNVSVIKNSDGNTRMDKSGSQGKIDGAVALVMGLDSAMRYVNIQSYMETGEVMFV